MTECTRSSKISTWPCDVPMQTFCCSNKGPPPSDQSSEMLIKPCHLTDGLRGNADKVFQLMST